MSPTSDLAPEGKHHSEIFIHATCVWFGVISIKLFMNLRHITEFETCKTPSNEITSIHIEVYVNYVQLSYQTFCK